jgi:hypothetical protein
MGVGGAVAAEGTEEGEDVLADDRVHVGGLEVLETGPAQVLVGALLGILAAGEDGVLNRFFFAVGQVLFQDLLVVEAAEEEEVGDLLHDFEGVGDASGPEGVPDTIDLAADFTGEHGKVLRLGSGDRGLGPGSPDWNGRGKVKLAFALGSGIPRNVITAFPTNPDLLHYVFTLINRLLAI